MRIRILNALLAVTISVTLAGCGGGGGTTAPPAGVILSGVASKGLIKNGVNNVKVFALNADGSKGALLVTTSTGPNGEYSADVGSTSGAVLVEVSGSYTDEATGQAVTILADKPLRAAVDSVSGNITVAVSPLTELAVKKAGTALTPAAIKAANAVVSDLFKVDIIGTKPVEPVKAALDAATQEQKDYTLALATISQMANSTSVDAVFTVIDSMKVDIETHGGNSMSQVEVDKIKAAQVAFFAPTNSKNQTGETAPPSSISNLGLKTAVVKLSVGGVSGKIFGIDVTLDLPAGVTVVAKSDGDASGAVTALGGAASGSLTVPKYTAASATAPGKVRIGLVSGSGFNAGEFVTINCDIAPEKTVSAGGFTVESGAVVDDVGGIPIAGATVTASATIK